MTVVLYSAIGLAILLALFWLLFSPHWNLREPDFQATEIESLQVLHCRHFPQIAQVLRTDDLAFVERKAGGHLARQLRRERSRILRKYLNGLAQDFARLERLARLLAALSPEISRKQEWEWLKLGTKFRVLFGLVALRIALGGISLHPLARLTDLIVVQATALDLRMTQLTDVLPAQLQMNSQS